MSAVFYHKEDLLSLSEAVCEGTLQAEGAALSQSQQVRGVLVGKQREDRDTKEGGWGLL